VGNGDIGENVPALEFAGPVERFGGNVAVDHIDLAVPAESPRRQGPARRNLPVLL
jgi:hypothetical protein